jgi:hypothetical protein
VASEQARGTSTSHVRSSAAANAGALSELKAQVTQIARERDYLRSLLMRIYRQAALTSRSILACEQHVLHRDSSTSLHLLDTPPTLTDSAAYTMSVLRAARQCALGTIDVAARVQKSQVVAASAITVLLEEVASTQRFDTSDEQQIDFSEEDKHVQYALDGASE